MSNTIEKKIADIKVSDDCIGSKLVMTNVSDSGWCSTQEVSLNVYDLKALTARLRSAEQRADELQTRLDEALRLLKESLPSLEREGTAKWISVGTIIDDRETGQERFERHHKEPLFDRIQAALAAAAREGVE